MKYSMTPKMAASLVMSITPIMSVSYDDNDNIQIKKNVSEKQFLEVTILDMEIICRLYKYGAGFSKFDVIISKTDSTNIMTISIDGNNLSGRSVFNQSELNAFSGQILAKLIG